MLAYLFYSFGASSLLNLFVWLIILAIIFAVAIWAVRYIGLPEIIVKCLIVLAVLIVLLNILDFAGVFGGSTLVIHDTPR